MKRILSFTLALVLVFSLSAVFGTSAVAVELPEGIVKIPHKAQRLVINIVYRVHHPSYCLVTAIVTISLGYTTLAP